MATGNYMLIAKNFPVGGGNSKSGCANPLFCKFFCQKLHENERIWTRERSLRSLGSANDFTKFLQENSIKLRIIPRRAAYLLVRLSHLGNKIGECRGGSRILLGAAADPPGGVPTYKFSRFSQKNCMKLRKFYPVGGLVP